MARDAGVTLIEMLVALAIFAVIGLAGFTVLDTVIRTGERTDGRLEVLTEIDRALILFDRDMTESLPASHRRDDGALLFLRPLAAAPRSPGTGLAEVSYAVAEGRLTRRIKRAGRDEVEQTILSGIGAASLRFLDAVGDWHALEQLDSAVPPLRAVELTLTLSPDMSGRSDADHVRRLVPLAQPAIVE